MTANDYPINHSSGATALARRDWLKAAAGVLLGAGVRNARADDLWAKAKTRLKLGIHTGPYAGLRLEEAARRIKDDGFTAVLTEYAFADVRFDPLKPDWDAATKITGCFERNGIQIVAVFGYVNLVSPDEKKRAEAMARMATLVDNWWRLGCSNISTETGTFNPQSDWVDAPENATEAGYLKCRKAFEGLARIAEKARAVVSIEPYWRNIIDSVDRAERLLKEVNSPALKLVMDPCNYFRKEDLPRQQAMMEDMFRRLGPQIVLAHAKDVKAAADGTDLPAAGRGVLDYPLYLRLLAQLDREVFLILEHVELADVARARDFVISQLERV